MPSKRNPIVNAQKAEMVSLAALSNEDRLRAGLDPLTRRDLVVDPPRANETMQQVGVSSTNLDGPVRSWINRAFREPKGLTLLTRGAITTATIWQALVAMMGS